MDREELHKRIRKLLFSSSALSTSFARGEFRSVFRGRGLDFDSLREYSPDDDARLIDWNVSVRSRQPHVRAYREDRSLSLFLVIDRSASMDEGSGQLSKGEMALLSAALLGHAASLRDMPVGGLHFDKGTFGYRDPRRGRAHVLALVDQGLDQEAGQGSARGLGQGEGPGGTGLAGALGTVARLLKRRSLVIVLSDWRSPGWKLPLAILGRRHDVVAVRVSDGLERGLPTSGSLPLSDAESGKPTWMALGSRGFRRAWQGFWAKDKERIQEDFAECRVGHLDLDTGDDPARSFLEFFDSRRKRFP
ncbi:MAG: DUF58 domain-containing protein [Spirochaetota bacterium]